MVLVYFKKFQTEQSSDSLAAMFCPIKLKPNSLNFGLALPPSPCSIARFSLPLSFPAAPVGIDPKQQWKTHWKRLKVNPGIGWIYKMPVTTRMTIYF